MSSSISVRHSFKANGGNKAKGVFSEAVAPESDPPPPEYSSQSAPAGLLSN